MNTFEFLVDQLPFGFAFNFENYLFNKVKHINTQEVDQRADYFIINNIKKRIEGKIHFLLKDGIAYSPYKSLFGSFEFSPRIHPKLISDFWKFIEMDLQSRKISKVSITSYAECYAPQKAKIIENALQNAGFNVDLKAVNHHIDIREEQFESFIHPMEARRLARCRSQNFQFLRETDYQATEIYDYLDQCRAEQGLQLSITKRKLFRYLELFPQNYHLFSVRSSSDIMAATVAIKVHRKILYSFLPGSLRKYKNFSPTVMLNEGLYNYCQIGGIDLLDLGISTEKNGKDQKSLIDFKERIGGKKSFKYFFSKVL